MGHTDPDNLAPKLAPIQAKHIAKREEAITEMRSMRARGGEAEDQPAISDRQCADQSRRAEVALLAGHVVLEAIDEVTHKIRIDLA